MVTIVITLSGFLSLLFPYGLIAVVATIMAGLEFWRGTLRRAGKLPIGSKPLVVGYLMFGAGWMVTSFLVAIANIDIPFLRDTIIERAAAVFLGGSLLAVLIFTVGGLPAVAFLVRRGRLGYRSGAVTVALFILAAALVVWVDPEVGEPGVRGLVRAMGIACLFMLLPAGGAMAGLVFSYRRCERDPERIARRRRAMAERRGPPRRALWRFAKVASPAILAVALATTLLDTDRSPVLATVAEPSGPTAPATLLALQLLPADAAGVRALVDEIARSEGITVHDYSGEFIRADRPMIAIELARGSAVVMLVLGGREFGATPVTLQRLTADHVVDALAGRLTDGLRARWPVVPAEQREG